MNRFVAFFLGFSLFWSNPAYSDPEVATVKKGQPAPFDGTILNPEAAAKVLATGESDLQRCLIESERSLATQKAEDLLKFKSKEAELVACQYRLTENQQIYSQHIEYLEKRANEPQWVKPTLFAGGVVTGIAVVVISAYTLDKIQEN